MISTKETKPCGRKRKSVCPQASIHTVTAYLTKKWSSPCLEDPPGEDWGGESLSAKFSHAGRETKQAVLLQSQPRRKTKQHQQAAEEAGNDRPRARLRLKAVAEQEWGRGSGGRGAGAEMLGFYASSVSVLAFAPSSALKLGKLLQNKTRQRTVKPTSLRRPQLWPWLTQLQQDEGRLGHPSLYLGCLSAAHEFRASQGNMETQLCNDVRLSLLGSGSGILVSAMSPTLCEPRAACLSCQATCFKMSLKRS